MKILNLQILCFISTIAACVLANSQPTGKTLEIDGRKLTLEMHTKCPQPQPSRKELAKYLAQYDPSGDPRLDIRDETPWSREEIKETQDWLVENGFYYPNGKKSVITWMDFDGDGICDFTASAGIGGMRSIDRMFLFRGLSNGQYQLVDSYHTYMEGSSILVPYIPIKVSGEKLPVLAKGQILMQWQNDGQQFITCETLSSATLSEKQQQLEKNEKSWKLLTTLCPYGQKIADWTVNQLPNKNKMPY